MIKKKKSAALLFGIFILMIIISLFIAKYYDSARKNYLEKIINVNLKTKVDPNLPWKFNAIKKSIEAKIGQVYKLEFKVENYGSNEESGRAIYDVEPNIFKKYFVEIDCFCYKKQTLLPGEKSTYSITFYIDVEALNNPETNNIRYINISYTFLDSKG